METAETVTCYRHLDRAAGVRCQRCERPICPACMVSASVGFHCPACAHGQRQKVVNVRNLGSRPTLTLVLIAVNVAVFVVGAIQSGGDILSSGSNPYVDDGGLAAVLVDRGDWWRLITSGFLHAGFLHLAFNMMALYYLGSVLEHVLGSARFALLYFTAMLAGSFGVLVASPNTLTVGASGAIFGLMGASIAGQRSQGISPWESGIGGLLMVNLLFTFLVPNISIGGHLGGLAGGLVGGWLLFDFSRQFRSARVGTSVCAGLGVACAVGALWVAANPVF